MHGTSPLAPGLCPDPEGRTHSCKHLKVDRQLHIAPRGNLGTARKEENALSGQGSIEI